jgi:hypothetical protein
MGEFLSDRSVLHGYRGADPSSDSVFGPVHTVAVNAGDMLSVMISTTSTSSEIGNMTMNVSLEKQ